MNNGVLIVGAGPTGLTAAMELSRFGIPVRIIDRRDAPATTSRAIGVQARTVELLAQRGLADELIKLGNKGLFGSVYGGGERVFHLDFAHVDSPYPFLLFVSQAETERLLREKAQSQNVSVEWRTEFIALGQSRDVQGENIVTATLKLSDGSYQTMQYDWLIDAEGAGSLVRHTLDMTFEGKTRSEDYVLGDGHIDGDLAETDFHIFSSPHGFLGLFPMGQKRFRLIASNPLTRPSKDTAPSPEEIQQIYNQRSHIPATFTDVTWTSWFHINSRMVSRLKAGHLFLGGDAAHIHSPAGAQGMNTGIQDMINLCWKLAFVMQSKAPITLLETYEGERLPVIHGVLANTEHLTDMIGTEDHVVRTLFNHLGPWIGSRELVQTQSTNQMAQLAINYRNSPLTVNGYFAGSIRNGDRLPDYVVEGRIYGSEGQFASTCLHAILNPTAFTLLLVAEPGAECVSSDDIGDLQSILQKSSTKIDVIEIRADASDMDDYKKIFGGRSCVSLIRPDGYVSFTVSSQSLHKTLSDYIDQWFSLPPVRP